MLVIVHYGELALKGGNRTLFERTLMENIRRSFAKENISAKVRRLSGRFAVEIPDTEEKKRVRDVLRKQFGVVSFAFAEKTGVGLEAMRERAKDMVMKETGDTFRITTVRSDKSYPLSSQAVNEKVGEYVNTPRSKRVDLEHPDVTCRIEIVGGEAYLSTKRFKGPGGLPLGTGSGALALLSGGIDSPVAAYMVRRRGTPVDYVHFHSYPYTDKRAIDKVRRIVKRLDAYDAARLHLVPFADIQKAIVSSDAPPELRVVLYRRCMLRLAERIAECGEKLALVTGDALGQVASQTLENIAVVSEAVRMPVLRPLIGFDKETIIKKARRIGTYDISIEPCEDVCSRFVPKHPATRARYDDVRSAERSFPLEPLLDDALRQSESERT